MMIRIGSFLTAGRVPYRTLLYNWANYYRECSNGSWNGRETTATQPTAGNKSISKSSENNLPRIVMPTRPLMRQTRAARRHDTECEYDSANKIISSTPDLLEMEDASHYRKPKRDIYNKHQGLDLKSRNNNRNFKGDPPNLPMIQGEALFGIFPVLLALKARRRECHQLYMKQKLYDQTHVILENSETNDESVPEKLNGTVDSDGKLNEGLTRRTLSTDSDSSFTKGSDIVSNVLAEVVTLAHQFGVSITPCSRQFLDKLSSTRPHQGICLDASKLTYERFTSSEFERGFTEKNLDTAELWLVLDSIQDPMNVGAIIRTATYFGVDRIITTRENSCRLSPVVSKASAGTLETFPMYAVNDLSLFTNKMRSLRWDVVGTVSKRHVSIPNVPVLPLQEMKLSTNTVIVLGNEGKGISPSILSQCNHLVTISSGSGQLHTDVDSLNVSVSAGVILHHMVESRRVG